MGHHPPHPHRHLWLWARQLLPLRRPCCEGCRKALDQQQREQEATQTLPYVAPPPAPAKSDLTSTPQPSGSILNPPIRTCEFKQFLEPLHRDSNRTKLSDSGMTELSWRPLEHKVEQIVESRDLAGSTTVPPNSRLSVNTDTTLPVHSEAEIAILGVQLGHEQPLLSQGTATDRLLVNGGNTSQATRQPHMPCLAGNRCNLERTPGTTRERVCE